VTLVTINFYLPNVRRFCRPARCNVPTQSGNCSPHAALTPEAFPTRKVALAKLFHDFAGREHERTPRA
jgi:hypothetical protein